VDKLGLLVLAAATGLGTKAISQLITKERAANHAAHERSLPLQN
jgi:hypothetical protein